MAVEEERKYDVGDSFTLPELSAVLPAGGTVVAREPVVLTATYYDTGDLRLARAGAALRYRVGDREPWTVKLATEVAGVRHEISRSGPPDRPPAELVGLVSAISRGAPLRPAVVLRSRRHRWELRDGRGRVLAEIADDAVSVMDRDRESAGFRELEVERVEADRELLDRIEEQLLQAGAVPGRFPAKHVRALGETATAPPDLPVPGPLPPDPTAGQVLIHAVTAGTARILANDPLARLREPLPDGDTPVHQMRVGARRLRSQLRTFAPLLSADWADRVRDELRWLAAALGEVRDAEVLRQRLARTATDPLAPLDADAVGYLDRVLADEYRQAYERLLGVLDQPRYLRLLDTLVAATRDPELSASADQPAARLLPELVGAPWRRLARGSRRSPAAAALTADAPDEHWHAVRISGKRARYAVEAVADVVGAEARALAKALAKVQDVLGEHQDAVVAGRTWLRIAAERPDDHRLAVTAGRLFERERAAIRRARAAFPAVWQAASRPELVAWLPEARP